MAEESRGSQETWGLRAQEACKVLPARQGNQGAGDVLAVMVPEGCLDRLAQREIEALMASLDCQGRKAIGVNPDHQVLQEPQAKMEIEAMMESTDLEASPVNLDPVGCWDPKAPPALRDHQA